MVLTHPDFTVLRPAGLSPWITDAMWWFWLRLQELEPTSQLGGIAAAKRGFHSSGQYNLNNYPGDYSIRDPANRRGAWRTTCAALDWTFPEAHQRDYRRIAFYMQRLLASARDPNDPRLDVLFEFFGQADTDDHVEGWNEYQDRDATSDPSHWFHIHFSALREYCDNFWAMWQILTVLMGWTVAQWRASLPGATPQHPEEEDDMGVLYHAIDDQGTQITVDDKVLFAYLAGGHCRVAYAPVQTLANKIAAPPAAPGKGTGNSSGLTKAEWNGLMTWMGVEGNRFDDAGIFHGA